MTRIKAKLIADLKEACYKVSRGVGNKPMPFNEKRDRALEKAIIEAITNGESTIEIK